MDETDSDDDWCVVGDTDTPEVIRAVQTEERVPEEGLELIILDSGSDASLLPCDHPEAGKVKGRLESCWRTLKEIRSSQLVW